MSYEYFPLDNHEGISYYITKKGKKMYRVRVRYTNQGKDKEHSKQGFYTLASAKAYKLDITPKLYAGSINAVIGNKRTLNDQWNSYRKLKVSSHKWNKATESTNLTRITHFLKRFGHMPLKEITRNDVQEMINDLYKLNPDYSQDTVRSFVKVFWQVIDDAVEDEFLEKNKFKKISWDKPGGWKPKKKVLEYEDYIEFMRLAKLHMRKDIYRCFYMTTFGLRRSEVYGIRQSAIRFLDNDLAKVDINWARTRDYPEGKNVKSRDSERFIIVDEKGTQLLHDQIDFARKVKAVHEQTLHFEDYIFITPENGKPYYIEMLNDHINAVAEKMDKKVNVSPHMFRHMFATHASANGVDSLQLRKFLGHADIDMTNRYTHGSLEGAENVMRLTEKYRN